MGVVLKDKFLKLFSWNHEGLMLILLMLFPFHTFYTAHYLPSLTGIDKMAFAPWREGILLLLMLKMLARALEKKEKRKITSWHIWVLTYIGVGIIMMAAQKFSFISIYGFRNYFFPFAFFFAFYLLPIKNPGLLMKGTLTSAFFVSLFGFVQLFFLGPPFLLQFGYGENGFLGSSFYIVGAEFQRVVGTFSSPNEFGFYLCMIILVAIYYQAMTKEKWPLFLIAVELWALVDTFSRSSWVAFFVAACYLLVKLNFISWVLNSVKRIPRKWYFVPILLIGAGIYFSWGIFGKIYEYLIKTITLQDPSSVGHFTSIIDGFKTSLQHPFGFGLGRNGPKGEALGLQLNNVESSFYLVSYELGLVGLMAFLLVMATTFLKFRENPHTRVITISLTIALLINFFFLPTIQSLDQTYLYWTLIGLFLNKDFFLKQTGRRYAHEQDI